MPSPNVSCTIKPVPVPIRSNASEMCASLPADKNKALNEALIADMQDPNVTIESLIDSYVAMNGGSRQESTGARPTRTSDLSLKYALCESKKYKDELRTKMRQAESARVVEKNLECFSAKLSAIMPWPF